MNRTLNIDIYDLTEERVEKAAALLLRLRNRQLCGPDDLAALSDALSICQSASLSFAEPVHIGTERFTSPKQAREIQRQAIPTTVAEQHETARCQLCEQPGERLPVSRIYNEPLWVCRTPGCPRRDNPAVRTFFETGQR